jgi:replicative DNA helicase Mcm
MQQLTNVTDWADVLTAVAKERVAEMAISYPERRAVEIPYMDVFRHDPDIAEEILEQPEMTLDLASEAVNEMSLPVDINMQQAEVRFVDLPDDLVYTPGELTAAHTGKYIGIMGVIDRITTADEKPINLAFECLRCGMVTTVPQMDEELQEPADCPSCERRGPFRIDERQSTWEDYVKMRIDHPPSSQTISGEKIDGDVTGPLVNEHGEFGLVSRAGESATVYGVLKRAQKGTKALFERKLDVVAVDFESQEDNIDVDEHKEAFEALAAQDDAVDLMAQSIVPELYATDAWDTALEWSVAYLFGAPRIDIPNGPTYRGDIHGAIISDFGMGKSMYASGLVDFSPKIIRKSATGLSSDVGLTAAAVQDDFGQGQWTIRPGILVQANGGHVVLDEIDKGPDDLSKINDAIEGEQTVDVDKAGISATYPSRVGLLVLGNPKDSRFDPYQSVSSQLGVDQSTLSRFDGIVTMMDTIDTDTDGAIAKQSLTALKEAQEMQFGDGEPGEILSRPVSPEVGRAWVKYAREHVYPKLQDEHIPVIQAWYAEEVRKLNTAFDENYNEGADMPVPASPRVIHWVSRFASAFARCHLRDEVTDNDVDRAIALAKRLISQRWTGDKFVPEESGGIEQKIVDDMNKGEWRFVEAVAMSVREDEDVVREMLESMRERGIVIEEQGKFQRV